MRTTERPTPPVTPGIFPELSDSFIFAPAPKSTGQAEARSTVTRRPPALRLNPEAEANPSELRHIIAKDVAQIAGTETAEFAFAVSELAYRLEAPVEASGNVAAQDGLAALSRMARMYEPQIVLQSQAEA